MSFTLVLAIYGQARVGGDPVPQDGRVPALQGDGQAAPLVAQHFLLLLACVPGQSPGQPPDRLFPPAPQGLHHHRHEGGALPPAGLPRAPHLPLMGVCGGVAHCGGRPRHGDPLQGVYDGHIDGCVEAGCKLGNE